jgi:hypothetical protein
MSFKISYEDEIIKNMRDILNDKDFTHVFTKQACDTCGCQDSDDNEEVQYSKDILDLYHDDFDTKDYLYRLKAFKPNKDLEMKFLKSGADYKFYEELIYYSDLKPYVFNISESKYDGFVKAEVKLFESEFDTIYRDMGDYDERVFVLVPKDLIVREKRTITPHLDYPNKCILCGAPAYNGLNTTECTNPDCENFEEKLKYSKLILKKLIRMANDLDNVGMFKVANLIDEACKKINKEIGNK